MGKDPAFLFYPNDYIGGTMGMTFEEKGAYMDLLILQFNRGHMGGHMVGQVIGQLEPEVQAEILSKFKKDSKGRYYNERLEIEVNKRKAFVQSRNNNLSGKNQYTKKGDKKEGHMSPHMEDVNINEIDIAWLKWKQYKKAEFNFKYKSEISEHAAKTELINLSDNDAEIAIKIIDQSIANGWKGLFKLQKNGTDKKGNGASEEAIARIIAEKFGSDSTQRR